MGQIALNLNLRCSLASLFGRAAAVCANGKSEQHLEAQTGWGGTLEPSTLGRTAAAEATKDQHKQYNGIHVN
jgi:hypothetical protein